MVDHRNSPPSTVASTGTPRLKTVRTSYLSCSTYSEFTGRSQQHTGPVHPPHPSRSSLAVARSLSERSKEDKNLEASFSDVPVTKSYSDQIDEVMEQLNANCDLSMDDLFSAANSGSTSTLNAGGDKKGKKSHHGLGAQQGGLTKKSNSTSQLSVSGKFLLTFFFALFLNGLKQFPPLHKL